MAIFYYPINVGIAIACGFLLGLGAAVSVAVSYVPGQFKFSSNNLSVTILGRVFSFHFQGSWLRQLLCLMRKVLSK